MSWYYTSATGVRLRPTPGTEQAPIIDDLGIGRALESTDEHQTDPTGRVWLRVRATTGESGWVALEYVAQIPPLAGLCTAPKVPAVEYTPTVVQPPTDYFPWRNPPAGIVLSAKFQAMPDYLKDAISWFYDPSDWERAAAVASCESGPGAGWERATNDTRGRYGPSGSGMMTIGGIPTKVTEEFSVGVWQVNIWNAATKSFARMSEAEARNVWIATEFAARLTAGRRAMGGSGWEDWGCGRVLGYW